MGIAGESSTDKEQGLAGGDNVFRSSLVRDRLAADIGKHGRHPTDVFCVEEERPGSHSDHRELFSPFVVCVRGRKNGILLFDMCPFYQAVQPEAEIMSS